MKLLPKPVTVFFLWLNQLISLNLKKVAIVCMLPSFNKNTNKDIFTLNTRENYWSFNVLDYLLKFPKKTQYWNILEIMNLLSGESCDFNSILGI